MQTSVAPAEHLLSEETGEYLSELRWRLLICVACLLLLFFALLPFSGSLYQVYSAPIVKLLPGKMLLAPPDVLSQILVAIFMILLYELGLLAYRIKCHIIRSTKSKRP